MGDTTELPSVEEMERVLLESASVQADTTRIDTADWLQNRTPSSPLSNHNIVLRARLAPSDVQAKVAAIVDEHRARRANFRWIVASSSTPPTLGQELLAAGLTHDGIGIGMARPVPNLSTGEASDVFGDLPELTYQSVTLKNVDAYAAFAARAWQKGDDFASAIAKVSRHQLTQPDDGVSRSESWLASLDGTPVAACHARFLPTVGYLQGAAVLPPYRGRGIYRATIQYRLAMFARANLPMAVIWADAGGAAGACGKLGFREVARANFYEWSQGPLKS